jgi:methyl-accepting chemotaxis protein
MRAFHSSISARILATVLGLGLVAAVLVGAAILSMDGLRARTEALQRATLKAVYAERVNRLVAMVVMDSRGIYASRDPAEIRYFADGLIRHLDQMEHTMTQWRALATPERRQQIEALADSLKAFSDLRRNLVATAFEKGPDAAREIGEANRNDRQQLNAHLQRVGELYGEDDVRQVMTGMAEYQRGAITLLFLTGMLGLLAALIAAWMVVSRTILRPLTTLKMSLDRMAQGDLERPISETARRDEIGSIARSTENFRHSLNRMRAVQEREHQNDLQRIARAERVQRATGRFEQVIHDCISNLHRSIAQVVEVADALRALAATSTRESQTLAGSAHEAAANAQTIATAAEQLQATASAIFQQIARSSATAAAAARNAEAASHTVDQLDGAVTKIGEVVALINAIAEQTNLLALNATIESARAGEAGRGFSVVASEVKTLAQQTSTATGDIQQQIATVQSAARDAVGVIQTFDAAIGDLNHAVGAITEAVRQQNAATREISGGVTVSAQSVEALSRGVTGINDGIRRTHEASQSASNVVGLLQDQAVRLEQEVSTLLKEINAA